MGQTVFLDENGHETTDKSARHRVSPWDVARTWAQYSPISPRYAVATGLHETNYTVNERVKGDQSDGSSSDGIFQISHAEAVRSGHGGTDLLTIDGACAVLAWLANDNLQAIRAAARKHGGNWSALDELAYLTVAHNQGQHAAVKSIETYGLDWSRYARDNAATDKPGFPGARIVAYGNDAMTGGPDYQTEWDALHPSLVAEMTPWVQPLAIGIAGAYVLREIAIRMGILVRS